MFQDALSLILWCLVLLMLIAAGLLRLLTVLKRRAPLPAPDEHSTHFDSIGTFHAEALDQQDKV
jgi:hypothetical protein